MPSLIDDLITAYLNERNTKEILPFFTKIEIIKSKMKTQKEKIKRITGKLKHIYEKEYERISFFLFQYLNIRIKKMKNFNLEQHLLSFEELRFYNGTTELAKKYEFFHDAPFLNKEYVGFIVVSDKNVIIDGNHLEIMNGDFYVCEIEDIRQLVYNGDVFLI